MKDVLILTPLNFAHRLTCIEARIEDCSRLIVFSALGLMVTRATFMQFADACKECNSNKGGKRLYEWIRLARKDEVPRIAEGKYLKLLYDLHEKSCTLNVDKNDLKTRLCDMRDSCIKEGHEGELTVYCFEGIFNRN